MTRCVFAIPGDLATPTGGYAYARSILPLLRTSFELSLCPLPASFPFPAAGDIDAATAALMHEDKTAGIFLIDGLALGAMPAKVLSRLTAPVVALVHHPLCLEDGLTIAQSQMLRASEQAALRISKEVIVTSYATARDVSALFAVDPSRITVAEPGVRRGENLNLRIPLVPASIVSVGTVVPRKGYDVLIEALSLIADLEWRATIGGGLDRAPETVTDLRGRIARLGLEDRVTLAGALSEDDVTALYNAADIFALASRYEGYGMAFAEAMAHGLPVVASGKGAVRDTVPDSAGFYIPVGDAKAFADALRLLVTDTTLRQRKADGARLHSEGLPTWERTAGSIASVLQRAAA